MQRSRLKNIINKSKELSNPIGAFDKFKMSLPKEIEIGNDYRLESAWKAYGSPKDYNEALWQGLIQPIDENTFKLPSIGYNEETDEYEYLNKGKDNETVAKDIRVWDNDVIPLVKELKQGGFIRVYDEEKDCWKYSKNKSQETQNKQGEVIEEFLKEINEKQINEPQAFKQGGQMNVIPEGALHAHKNHMDLAEDGTITKKGIPVISKDEDGNIVLVAEVEKEELTLTKEVTDKVENWYKKYFDENTSKKEKDELAIKCGKFLTHQILFNTDDRVNLINKLKTE